MRKRRLLGAANLNVNVLRSRRNPRRIAAKGIGFDRLNPRRGFGMGRTIDADRHIDGWRAVLVPHRSRDQAAPNKGEVQILKPGPPRELALRP